MTSSGMFHRVTLVRTDVSEEFSASIIRVKRIGELGTTLAVTSNRRSPKRLFLQEQHGVHIPEDAILQFYRVFTRDFLESGLIASSRTL
jgi:hypothetical protein